MVWSVNTPPWEWVSDRVIQEGRKGSGMKHWYFLVGSLLVVCSSVSFSSASFLEKETDGNIIKLGSRKIIRQMKRINSAKEVRHDGTLCKNCAHPLVRASHCTGV